MTTTRFRPLQPVTLCTLVGLISPLFPVLAFAQPNTVKTDLLMTFDPDQHVIQGDWSQKQNELMVTAAKTPSICIFPPKAGTQYSVNLDFTRTDGNDAVGIVLPLGDRQVLLELSGWAGEAHGLSRVNQSSVRDKGNPTRVSPGTLVNGQRYQVAATVKVDAKNVSIQAKLNGEPLISYSGPLSSVEANIALRTYNNQRIALATANSVLTFHSLVLERPADSVSTESMASRPETASPPIQEGEVDLTQVNFQTDSGTTEIIDIDGEKVVRLQGRESVALLPNVKLANGQITAQIRSNTFSGIAFRSADLENYDLIYFRPQNSGTAKHANTVQYVCKGVDGADWATLRREFPGKYESGADISVDEWFNVRIEINEDTAKVYVENDPKPSLVVQPLIGGRSTGGIGIWGWDTAFRKFSFTAK